MPVRWRDYTPGTVGPRGGHRKEGRTLHPYSNDQGTFTPDPPPEQTGCNVYPKQRTSHQDKIHADDGIKHTPSQYEAWCDCCGKQPIAIFPMFNRLMHTVRLCDDCLTLGLAALDSLYDRHRPPQQTQP